MLNSNSTLTGFDAVAERYDADEARNRTMAHIRARVYEQLCVAFGEGSKLIEVGSGTGTEAARLASERGCRVVLVDVSPQLLSRAMDKVRAVAPQALLGSHLLPARSVAQLAGIYGEASFDGAYSSLGPLNCEASLRPVAEGLAMLVRGGGSMVLSLLNRRCASEVAWFVLHGEWREASRRWGGAVQASAYPGGPKQVTTWYYSRRDVERAFFPDFRVDHVEALPLLWPPTYLDFLVTRFHKLFRVLEPAERWAARQRFLRDLGDHVLIRLRRRAG